MLLIGHAGAKFGIPFPVMARASFGVKGANLPAVLRGLVACGWFSINCYFGALALHGLLNTLGMGLAAPGPGETISTSQFVCFLAFWALHLVFIWRGLESVRLLEVVAAPLMILASVALVVWAFVTVSPAQIFSLPAKVVEGCPKTWAALTGPGWLLGHAGAEHPRLHSLREIAEGPDRRTGHRSAAADGAVLPGRRDRLLGQPDPLRQGRSSSPTAC